jgi:FkbM family methyltransferase
MILPPKIKNALEKNHWYLSLRYSTWFLKLWLFFRPSVKKNLILQKELYLTFLPQNQILNIMFDIGSNEGFVSDILSRYFAAIVAVEPNFRNVKILKSRFKFHSNIKIVEAAVGSQNGKAQFFENKNDYALGTLSEKWNGIINKSINNQQVLKEVKMLTLNNLIEKYGTPFFIKIDVEGYEDEVLKGLTQKIPLISFEAILPIFYTETLNCIKTLISIDENYKFNFVMDHKIYSDRFLNENEIIVAISKLTPQTIEIFVKNFID